MKSSWPWVLFWLMSILVLVVFMAIQFSARQPATVGLDVGISVMRLALPLLVALLMQDFISREIDRKLYLTALSYPRARTHWLYGRVLAVALIAIVVLAAMALVLAALITYVGSGYMQATPVALGGPYLVTLMFMAVDVLIAIAVACLLAVSATTPSLVLIGTMGFMLIARSYTPIMALLQSNPYTVNEYVDPQLYEGSLSLIAFVLPDLARLDVRMIALYDKMQFLPTDWLVLISACLAYALTILALSAWVLNKREFS